MPASSSRLHGYIRRLLESRVSALWERLPQAPRVTQKLADILVGERNRQSRQPLAPTRYVLALPPAQADAVRQVPHLLDALAIAIHKAGRDVGLRFPVLPRVLVDGRAEMGTDDFALEATIWEPPHLQAVPLDPAENIPPPSAYFIINGLQVFSLEQPIVHIGRRPDNDLVLDDPRISRLHAQLRASRGRYMLFDLDSTGGTFVNDKRIRATVLYPGDVVMLTGTTMVYGQRATRPLQGQPYKQDTGPIASLDTTVTLRPSLLDEDEEDD